VWGKLFKQQTNAYGQQMHDIKQSDTYKHNYSSAVILQFPAVQIITQTDWLRLKTII